jgi:hypothetical protein
MSDEKLFDDTAPRDWQVTIDCCKNGGCAACRERTGNGQTAARPGRIIHSSKVTEAYAKKAAKGWAFYNGKAEKMP